MQSIQLKTNSFKDYKGLNKERKVINRKQKEKNREKKFYVNGHDFSTKNNPVPQEYENQIICEDSLRTLQKLPDNCIDLVFTSPPYNFGLDYSNDSTDAKHWKEYFDTLHNILKECVRVLNYGGRLVINIQPLYSDYIPTHHIISKYLMDAGLIWKGQIIWEKNNYNCKYTAWGSWKSPSSPYLKYSWKFVEVFCKGDLKKAGDCKDADILGDDFKKWVYGKWVIAPERKMKKYGHPAMFPEELARRVILLFSFQKDIILDPFNGAGTTCIVAKKNNRRYLGIDISKDYCKTSSERLNALAKTLLTS